MKVKVFNVGQGSATAIEFANNKLGIIDCGKAVGGNPLYEYLKRKVDGEPSTEISFLALTHLDFDHINGFQDIYEDGEIRRRIRRFYCNQADYRLLLQIARRVLKAGSGCTVNPVSESALRSLRAVNELVSSCEKRGAEVVHHELVAPTPADESEYPVQLILDELQGDCEIEVWAPTQRLKDRVSQGLRRLMNSEEDIGRDLLGRRLESGSDWNSASIVMSVVNTEKRSMFCGDATGVTWSEVLALREDPVPCCVVVAPHHGAQMGRVNGQEFNDILWSHFFTTQTGCQGFAVISHGCANRYGHPHPETVAAIASSGRKLFCTEKKFVVEGDSDRIQAAFSGLGLALDFGAPNDLVVYKSSNTRCSGDIVYEISGNEVLDLRLQGPRCADDEPLEGCCLARV